jgi:hypothetical protein
MNCRRKRSERLSQNNVRASVQDPDDLSISFHRHPRNRSFSPEFEVLNAHLCGQLTAARGESLLQFGVKVIEYSHAGALPSVSLCRLNP